MDKFKGIAKGGWKPSGDRPIHRDSWKSDIKGMATGKKKDPYEEQRNHESAPLSSLKDPSSFAPPPKHSAYYGDNGRASSRAAMAPAEPSGGLGSVVPAPRPKQQEQVQEEQPKPPEPYRQDTSGLRTDHLPKPPVKRGGGGVESPARTASPSLPPRQSPALPARQATKPPPSLPPRMTENPTEYTPAPPPTYGEATKTNTDAGMINQGAANRLGQAGISIPGFGIGAQSTPPESPVRPNAPQLSELQQRFSRMNTSPQSQASPPSTPTSIVSAAAAKKPAPPPPPPKKGRLSGGSQPQISSSAPAPPPLPLASKPRPTG